jgi:sterol desaturase/sphingolipid hydroxylase (fatty acid hydroxylase superfamily)
MVIMRLTIGGLAYLAAMTAMKNNWGLLNWFAAPDWLAIIATVLFLDFAIYLQHILSHKWSLLWRLHQIHHTDLAFDASTAVRFHPLEIIISMFYKVLCIFLIGANPFAVIVFEIILNGTATFNHSNVNIPAAIDKKLRWLIITPDMHRIHHSTIVNETDSNYGFSISFWDRLCGTYTAKPEQPQQSMGIGLKGYPEQSELSFKKLLLLPFQALKSR